MIIIFKLLGAFCGVRVAIWAGQAPLSGLVIGGILGHSLDIVLSTKIQRAKAKRYWRARATEQYQSLFLTTVFSMLGKLCAADGDVNEKELASIERLISDTLKLKRRERKEALQFFQAAKRLNTSFQYDAAQYFEIHQRDPESILNFLAVMFDIAACDGKISEAEEQLLRSAAVVFHIPENLYESTRSRFMGGRTGNGSAAMALSSKSDDPYSILGCKPSDPVATIKQSYRKLVSDYHPDKIVSKELPEDFTKFAHEKFKAIQEAYEAVKLEKGFS